MLKPRIEFALLVLLLVVCSACGDDAAGSEPEVDSGVVDAGLDVGDASVPDGSKDTGLDEDAADAEADMPESFDFGVDPPGTCNGAAHLCDRRIDEVAYVTTHNAYSTQEDGYIGPNQTHTMRQQLRDGVRGLMLDVYDNGEFPTSLCHSACIFGERSLEDGLREVAEFLEARPRNVVTLILESYVDGASFANALAAVGLDDQVWVPSGDTLPTLRELIDAETQLIVLTDEDAAAFPGYLDVWSWAWDTDWSNASIEDFDCEVLRGSTDNPLFILNHFLTDPVANTTLAERANTNPFLRTRVNECAAAAGQLPNYVTVDFYEIGDVFEVVDELNAP